MLERIERHSGSLLMLAVTASGGQYGKLNKLRGRGICREMRPPERHRRGVAR
jgi:hypothetical protein